MSKTLVELLDSGHYQTRVDQPTRLGPGFFPLILAVILTLLGAVVLVQATRVEGEPMGPLALRGMLFILPAPVFFGPDGAKAGDAIEAVAAVIAG